MALNGVIFENGLTSDEVVQIEKIYNIDFPCSLKDFLMMALPISTGFYNWRNFDSDNINIIKQVISKPIVDIDQMAKDIYWCDDWGKEPNNEKDIVKEVRERLKQAPRLLPVYIHRYVPMGLNQDPPVISVCGTDIIYYGKNLDDYFKIEFGEKKQDAIDFQQIVPIPFWSNIM